MPAEADEAEVHTANKTTNEADAQANVADAKDDTTNKLDELAVAEGRAEGHVVTEGRAEGHVVAKGHVVSVDCVNDGFLYSLTKYSAIFAEVKGYFGIIGLNNQLVGKVWSCLHSLRTR